mmetsp:Transcript_134994/g.305558  ORF Transcript_134994/g.305558 Transcript_134994/m.305558 type:complete len:224 (-) Transcript_134994:2466-3137(-)
MQVRVLARRPASTLKQNLPHKSKKQRPRHLTKPSGGLFSGQDTLEIAASLIQRNDPRQRYWNLRNATLCLRLFASIKNSVCSGGLVDRTVQLRLRRERIGCGRSGKPCSAARPIPPDCSIPSIRLPLRPVQQGPKCIRRTGRRPEHPATCPARLRAAHVVQRVSRRRPVRPPRGARPARARGARRTRAHLFQRRERPDPPSRNHRRPAARGGLDGATVGRAAA